MKSAITKRKVSRQLLSRQETAFLKRILAERTERIKLNLPHFPIFINDRELAWVRDGECLHNAAFGSLLAHRADGACER